MMEHSARSLEVLKNRLVEIKSQLNAAVEKLSPDEVSTYTRLPLHIAKDWIINRFPVIKSIELLQKEIAKIEAQQPATPVYNQHNHSNVLLFKSAANLNTTQPDNCTTKMKTK